MNSYQSHKAHSTFGIEEPQWFCHQDVAGLAPARVVLMLTSVLTVCPINTHFPPKSILLMLGISFINGLYRLILGYTNNLTSQTNFPGTAQ